MTKHRACGATLWCFSRGLCFWISSISFWRASAAWGVAPETPGCVVVGVEAGVFKFEGIILSGTTSTCVSHKKKKKQFTKRVMSNSRFPQIEIIELKEDSMQFLLTHTDTSMANSLRRIMIAEVGDKTIWNNSDELFVRFFFIFFLWLNFDGWVFFFSFLKSVGSNHGHWSHRFSNK